MNTWTLELQMRDLGQWCPDDETRAAELIAAVNAERKPNNERPKLLLYSGVRNLRVNLDETTLWLEPGDHLIRAESPFRVMWSVIPDDEMDDIR